MTIKAVDDRKILRGDHDDLPEYSDGEPVEVRDLLLRGDQTFADRGEHALEGIDGSWRLYQLSE